MVGARVSCKDLWPLVQHVRLDPGEERFAFARDLVPGDVERVVALVVALGVGWKGATRHNRDSPHRPVWQNYGVEAARPEILDDLLDRYDRAPGRKHRFLLDADDPFEQYIAGAVGPQRMDDGNIGPVRRNGSKHFASERTRHLADTGIHFRQVDPEIAAEDRTRQPRGARLIGIGHGGMRMLFDFERAR